MYEGDVVRALPIDERVGKKGVEDMIGDREVVFDQSMTAFVLADFVPILWGGFESIEVIGNIHENPNLT